MNWFRQMTRRRMINRVRNGPPAARIAAIEALATYRDDEQAIAVIVELLGSDSAEVQTAAHRVLVSAGVRAVGPLSRAVRQLRGNSALVTCETLAEIARQCEAAVADLVDLLRFPSPELQAAARRALVGIGNLATKALLDVVGESARGIGHYQSIADHKQACFSILAEIVGHQEAADRVFAIFKARKLILRNSVMCRQVDSWPQPRQIRNAALPFSIIVWSVDRHFGW